MSERMDRDEVARILEIVAKDGLPNPRDLDVALDAIEQAIEPVPEQPDPLEALQEIAELTFDKAGMPPPENVRALIRKKALDALGALQEGGKQ